MGDKFTLMHVVKVTRLLDMPLCTVVLVIWCSTSGFFSYTCRAVQQWVRHVEVNLCVYRPKSCTQVTAGCWVDLVDSGTTEADQSNKARHMFGGCPLHFFCILQSSKKPQPFFKLFVSLISEDQLLYILEFQVPGFSSIWCLK